MSRFRASLPSLAVMLLAAGACGGDSSPQKSAPPTCRADAATRTPTADSCSSATDCASCTARVPCGWCNGRCTSGTAAASADGCCTGWNWLWRGIQCPGAANPGCAAHTDCATCAMDENACGWCTNVRRCVSGDRSGPATEVSGCWSTSGTWAWSPDSCR